LGQAALNGAGAVHLSIAVEEGQLAAGLIQASAQPSLLHRRWAH